MKAKEMFKELEYESYIDNKEFIIYQNKTGKFLKQITFSFKSKSIDILPSYFNIKLYNIITKQIQELGWIK